MLILSKLLELEIDVCRKVKTEWHETSLDLHESPAPSSQMLESQARASLTFIDTLFVLMYVAFYIFEFKGSISPDQYLP